MSRLLANSCMAYVAILVRALVAVTLSVVLARSFGPDSFGVYRTLLALIAVGTVIVKLGLDEALLRYGAQAFAQGARHQLLSMTLAATAIRLLAVGGIALAGSAALPELTALFAIEHLRPGEYAIVVLLFAGLSLYQLVGNASFSARQNNRVSDTISSLREVVVLFGVVLGFLLWRPDAYAVLGWRAVVISAEISLCLALTVRWGSRSEGNHFYLPPSRLLHYAGYSYLTTAAFGVPLVQLLQLVVSHSLGSASAGLYGACAVIIGLVNMLNPATALRKVIEPILVKRKTERPSEGDLQDAFSLLLRMTCFLMVPFAVVAFAKGDVILVTLFGAEYQNAWDVLAVMGVAQIFLGAVAAYAPIISLLERKDVAAFGGVIVPLSLGVSLALAETNGLIGVSVGLLVTGVLLWTYYYVAMKYWLALTLRIPFRQLARIVGNSIPAGLLLVLVNTPVWWLDMVTLMASGAIYLIASALCRPFSRDETDRVLRAVGYA